MAAADVQPVDHIERPPEAFGLEEVVSIAPYVDEKPVPGWLVVSM